MAKRGPKSVADMLGPNIPGARPAPPGDLEPAEQASWTTIVGSLPADWFGCGNLPLLKQYCRHIHNADLISTDIGQQREELAQVEARLRDVQTKVPQEPKLIAKEQRLLLQLQKRLRQTLQAHGYESDRIVRLATKLRLSQMSRYARADAAFAAPKDTPKPWIDWGNSRQ